MKKIVYSLLVFLLPGCKEKYNAPVVPSKTGYLVIEGNINSGQGASQLILSRSGELAGGVPKAEAGALLTVEGEDNSSFNFSETGPGRYSITNLNLNPTRKYRLRIRTTAGKEYLSDYAPVKNTPPIDSISWKEENQGVQLYIHTNDPTGRARYYQWEYEETWEIHAAYQSSLKYEITRGTDPSLEEYRVVFRDSSTFSFDPAIYYCWQYNNSSLLLLGSSAKLSKDIIELPLLFIPPASRKLSVLYSIRVKQYCWTKEGYDFLERMKKNTEATGTIFDAQPSELKGNIRCVSDPNEPVIGFINFCTIQERRVFIRVDQLSNWRYRENCQQFEVENISDSIKAKARFLTPTSPIKEMSRIVTFGAASPNCVDCTLSGSNIKPTYWP
jgi:hypothetical protein